MQNYPPVYLIVNADDFGYFRCVSRGIIECVSNGIVTATGIMPTSPALADDALWKQIDNRVDFGVHLTLTANSPLTSHMQRKLSRWNGLFPGKFAIVKAILTRQLTRVDVKLEWQAQIERCLDLGARLHFLNSHEHIHMLPPLFSVINELGKAYGIPHIRVTRSERPLSWLPGDIIRDFSMATLARINDLSKIKQSSCFIGLSTSGKLSIDYLARRLPTLKQGQVYELMCHPGYLDPAEVQDHRLLTYHRWENELKTLTSPEARMLCVEHGVKLIGYRDLEDAKNVLQS